MDLWELAQAKRDVLRLSTLVSADQFRKSLADDAGVSDAIDWCKRVGVSRVFLESFRNGYDAPRERVERARDLFNEAGVETAGGITPTRLGKDSTGWNIICCFSDPATQDRLRRVFEEAASMFDLIMIDDFLFTDCECGQCAAERGGRSWSDYRRPLMLRLSRERILDPARRVNPDVKIILKYPQWYDRFHLRGYDVIEQTRAFDHTWVGTELRDPDHNDPSVPRVLQYEGFWVMRWLGQIGGDKCLGGWFDEIATGPVTYVEQAWQTILGGAREMLLFAYGSLRRPNGIACVDALLPQLPALFELAEMVRPRPLTRGVVSPKPPHSEARDGRYIYDHAGMLGLPLIPATGLPPDAKSAFLSAENLADPQIADRMRSVLSAGGRLLATDGLLDGLPPIVPHPGLITLDVRGEPPSLLRLPPERLREIRRHLLEPLGIEFDAPPRVALMLLGDDLAAISNFNDAPADVQFSAAAKSARWVQSIPVETVPELTADGGAVRALLRPRSLTVLRCEGK